ncbi:MAG TPA: serine hydrolase domain-containing protein [Steroidobacteraceae bacterium]|nr:serine hydrolase domain-containing protein [Steroidobacteraceae bacterium]
MRRVLTIITAIVLLLVSLGIGVFTADLPFWQRALQLPLPVGEVYLPTAGIGADDAAPLAPAADAAAAFDPLVVEEAANRARAAGSRALLVMHRGQLAIERYFVADDSDSLLPATLIARPIAAMAVGSAIRDRRIESLDTPVSAILTEWVDEPRGRITLRQLLEETSGLEAGGDTHRLLQRSPWHDLAKLPRFATARGVRMLLGNDYESSALGFRLEHEAGGFRNISPANTQLAAVIVERATGQPYETYVDQRVWRAVGAGRAEMQLDRRAGMPAAHCCWRAKARDMLRVASLLATDGRYGEKQVLPPGWVQEMSRPSRVSAETGLQLRRLKLEGEDAVGATDGEGSGLWVVASRELVILDIAGNGEHPQDELAALLVRALAPRRDAPRGE